jgi:hypothetical protein
VIQQCLRPIQAANCIIGQQFSALANQQDRNSRGDGFHGGYKPCSFIGWYTVANDRNIESEIIAAKFTEGIGCTWKGGHGVTRVFENILAGHAETAIRSDRQDVTWLAGHKLHA